MKKFSISVLMLALTMSSNLSAQCIKDIQSLVDMPAPCFFVGNIDFDNPDCFDVATLAIWQYTWKIKASDNGDLIATYNGIAFQHTFSHFGGYEFCLEIEKDGDFSNGPEHVDCVTYTTCEFCSQDPIKVEYVKCPYGDGCEVNLSTMILAKNDVGLKPSAKFVITYLPTPQELLGGVQSYDIEYDEIDVEYNPLNDTILVFQNIKIPFKRGCFKSRIIFELEVGYGAHGQDGIACEEIELRSEEKFRCIACANEDGGCIASVVATEISNEEDSCDPFYFCNQLRENEDEVIAAANKDLMASPNPASERLHIEFSADEKSERELYLINSLGQRSMQINIPTGHSSTDIDLSDTLPGIYFLAMTRSGHLQDKLQIVVAK